MLLLVLHLTSVAALAGLSWVVQLVVYPSFRIAGPTAAWGAFHAAHSRGLTRAVVLPWAAQGATLAVLLVARPDGVPLWLVGVSAALGAATVVLTVTWAVPLHSRLEPYDDGRARALLRAHAWRTAAWTAGTASAAAMVLLAAP